MPGHVVMLRHPDAAIAPGLGMNRDIAGVVERAARIGVFGDADEIEDGQCRHGNSRTKPFEMTPPETPGRVLACPKRQASSDSWPHMDIAGGSICRGAWQPHPVAALNRLNKPAVAR